MNELITLICVLVAYLIGSIPFAILVSRMFGLTDPRSYGSKNPGATNVLRSGNKAAAAITLLLDLGKGALAVWLPMQLPAEWVVWGLQPEVVPMVAVAVVLGHMNSIFLKFRGGKGVATSAGVMIALNPWLGLATAVSWIIIAVFFRMSSLAAVISAIFAVFFNALLFGFNFQAVCVAVIGGLVVYRHRANIARLLRGTEPRIGRAKKG